MKKVERGRSCGKVEGRAGEEKREQMEEQRGQGKKKRARQEQRE